MILIIISGDENSYENISVSVANIGRKLDRSLIDHLNILNFKFITCDIFFPLEKISVAENLD
jgi:hypothetical protein